MSMFTDDLSVVIGAAKSGNTNLKLPFYISERNYRQDLMILNLSQRSFNGLRRNNINTIEDVIEKFDNLGELRNIGAISIREIRRKTAYFLYEAMSTSNRKAFWREFITLNNVEGISAK